MPRPTSLLFLLVLGLVAGCESPGPTESETGEPFTDEGRGAASLSATLTPLGSTSGESDGTVRYAAEVRHASAIAGLEAYLTFEPEPGRGSHVTAMGLLGREEVSPGVTRMEFGYRPHELLQPRHGWIGTYRAALFVDDADGARVRAEDLVGFTDTAPVIPLERGERWVFDFWGESYWKYQGGTCWSPGLRDQGVLTWTVQDRSPDRLTIEEHLLGEHIRRRLGCSEGDEVTPLETTTEFTLTLSDGFWRRTAGTTRVDLALNDSWWKLPAEVSVVPDTVQIGTYVPVTRVVPGEGIVRMDYHYFNGSRVTARWQATRR